MKQRSKIELMKGSKGFTLVELLVVMGILGILVTLIAGGFRSAQFRGRDAQRKSDLREIANALEAFYSDYGTFPSDTGSVVNACSYNPATSTGTPCSWGTGELTDGKTIYFKAIPKDPTNSQDYFYRIVPGSNNQKFQLFAALENTQDQDCLGGDCEVSPVSYSCGSATCNFSITSTNASWQE